MMKWRTLSSKRFKQDETQSDLKLNEGFSVITVDCDATLCLSERVGKQLAKDPSNLYFPVEWLPIVAWVDVSRTVQQRGVVCYSQ